MPIYLDNSATTRVCAQAVEAMTKCMREEFYNPSALYAPALAAQKKMRDCRDAILKAVHAPMGSKAVFLSGGTEAAPEACAAFYGAGKHMHFIGDCRRAGDVHKAVTAGWAVANQI